MQITTTRFGALDISEETFIKFPWGIPGFETLKSFVLIEHGESPFHWLQSTENPDVAFLVCHPDVHGLQYKVPENRLKDLDIQNEEDLAILNLISMEREQNQVRFHIRSPLLVNTVSRTGQQWNMDLNELKSCTILPEGTLTASENGPEFLIWLLKKEE